MGSREEADRRGWMQWTVHRHPLVFIHISLFFWRPWLWLVYAVLRHVIIIALHFHITQTSESTPALLYTCRYMFLNVRFFSRDSLDTGWEGVFRGINVAQTYLWQSFKACLSLKLKNIYRGYCNRPENAWSLLMYVLNCLLADLHIVLNTEGR